MNDTPPPSMPVAPNPYDAPPLEDAATRSAARASLSKWSLSLGVLIAFGLRALDELAYYTNPDVDLIWKIVLLPTYVLQAIVAGLGFAILFDCLAKGTFPKLMPGHWRLMVYAIMLIGTASFPGYRPSDLQVGYNAFLAHPFLPNIIRDALGVYLFAAILMSTRESRRWKLYAWICLAYYIVHFLMQASSYLRGFDPTLGHRLYLLSCVITALLLIVMVVVVLLAIDDDKDKKVVRDVYHWIGILYIFAVYGVMLITAGGFTFILMHF